MKTHPHSLRRAVRGFTLIELMVAVAIVGILAAIAYPAYMQSVLKSHRADAKTSLIDLAQREERYMSTANVYSNSPGALGYASTATFPMAVMTGNTSYYNLSVTVGNPATTFTATATPTGTQVKDACGTYTLTQDGTQSISGTANVGDCW
jgi:type IV pilus assembly protein PilE